MVPFLSPFGSPPPSLYLPVSVVAQRQSERVAGDAAKAERDARIEARRLKARGEIEAAGFEVVDREPDLWIVSYRDMDAHYIIAATTDKAQAEALARLWWADLDSVAVGVISEEAAARVGA